eukprot:sb/3460607/
MLLRKVNMFQSVIVLGPMGGNLRRSEKMKAMVGHCIHLPMPVQETVDELIPGQLVDPDKTIQVLGMPNKNKFVWNRLVNIEQIYKVLELLIERNPHYSNVTLPSSPEELLPKFDLGNDDVEPSQDVIDFLRDLGASSPSSSSSQLPSVDLHGNDSFHSLDSMVTIDALSYHSDSDVELGSLVTLDSTSGPFPTTGDSQLTVVSETTVARPISGETSSLVTLDSTSGPFPTTGDSHGPFPTTGDSQLTVVSETRTLRSSSQLAKDDKTVIRKYACIGDSGSRRRVPSDSGDMQSASECVDCEESVVRITGGGSDIIGHKRRVVQHAIDMYRVVAAQCILCSTCRDAFSAKRLQLIRGGGNLETLSSLETRISKLHKLEGRGNQRSGKNVECSRCSTIVGKQKVINANCKLQDLSESVVAARGKCMKLLDNLAISHRLCMRCHTKLDAKIPSPSCQISPQSITTDLVATNSLVDSILVLDIKCKEPQQVCCYCKSRVSAPLMVQYSCLPNPWDNTPKQVTSGEYDSVTTTTTDDTNKNTLIDELITTVKQSSKISTSCGKSCKLVLRKLIQKFKLLRKGKCIQVSDLDSDVLVILVADAKVRSRLTYIQNVCYLCVVYDTCKSAYGGGKDSATIAKSEVSDSDIVDDPLGIPQNISDFSSLSDSDADATDNRRQQTDNVRKLLKKVEPEDFNSRIEEMTFTNIDAILQNLDSLYELLKVESTPVASNDDLLEVLSFPELFFYGVGSLLDTRSKDLKCNPLQYSQTRLLSYHPHFRHNCQYLFYLVGQHVRRRITRSVFGALRNVQSVKNITAGKFVEMIKNNDPSIKRKVTACLRDIPGTQQYWSSVKQKLLAQTQQFGPPTFFLTLSPAEYTWPELISTLRELNKDLPGIDSLSDSELLVKEPVLTALYIHSRFTAILDFIKSAKPLGKVVSHFVRYEYQTRGTVHFHCFLWIEGAPVIGEQSDQEVATFIQSLITCRMPDKVTEPTLYEFVTKHQKHSCRSYCLKKVGNSKGKCVRMCRFGYPHHPIDCLLLRDVLTSIVGRATHKFKKRLYDLPRTTEERYINAYNPILLLLWGGNMDIQYIAENSFSIVGYVTKYMLKEEKSNINYDMSSIIDQPGSMLQKYLKFVSKYEKSYTEKGFKVHSNGKCIGKLKERTRTPVIYHHNYNIHTSPELFYYSLLSLYKPFRTEEEILGSSKTYQAEFLNCIDNQDPKYDDLRKFSKRRLDIDKVRENMQAQVDDAIKSKGSKKDDDNDGGDKDGVDDGVAVDDPLDDYARGDSDIKTQEDLDNFVKTLNPQQLSAYNKVTSVVLHMVDHDKGICKEASCLNQQLLLYVSGFGGTGKTYLIKALTAFCHVRREVYKEDVGALVMAPTGVAALSIGGNTVHFELSIPVEHGSIPKYVSYKPDKLQRVRQKFADLKVCIIDEVSMISNILLQYINMRLTEIFKGKDGNDRPFGGRCVILFGDLLQLKPVLASYPFVEVPFEQMQKLTKSVPFTLNLWPLFEFIELTINQRQKSSSKHGDEWKNLLSRCRVGALAADDYKLLNTRALSLQHADDPIKCRQEVIEYFINLTKQDSRAVCLLPTRSMVEDFNQAMLQKTCTDTVTVAAIDEIQPCAANVQKRIRQAIQKLDKLEDSRNTAALEKVDLNRILQFQELQIGLGVRVMLRRNIDVTKGLVNGSMGVIKSIRHNPSTKIVETLEIVFDGIEEPQLILRDRREIMVFVNGFFFRSQFPITISYAITIHKAQGLTLDTVLTDLGKKVFGAGQSYVCLSRAYAEARWSTITPVTGDRHQRVKADGDPMSRDIIALIGNPNGSHWVLIIIDNRPDKMKTIYFDSSPFNKRTMVARYVTLVSPEIDETTHMIEDGKSSRQTNYFDCGVFALANLELYLANKPADSLCQSKIPLIRAKILSILLEFNRARV